MRLVTFNVRHGAGQRDDDVDEGRLAAAVRALDPDVLALQEVDRAQPRSRHLDLADVAASAMDALDQRFVPALRGVVGAGPSGPVDPDDSPAAGYGVALLSRYPVTAWREVRLPGRPGEEPRVLVAGRFTTPLGAVTIACTHLGVVPPRALRQLFAVRRALARVSGPVLLLGDLNLDPPLPALLTGYRALARRRTVPADRPRRQIDHVLLRGRLGRVVAVECPAAPLSDHRPLVVELA